MPRIKDNRYDEVKRLPVNAIKVIDYAKQLGYKDHSIIYHNLKRKPESINYKIVVFQGINFVIPKNRVKVLTA
ncbi:MAG: hypothetical protein ABI091_27015 [Ferruginibacter sp.]